MGTPIPGHCREVPWGVYSHTWAWYGGSLGWVLPYLGIVGKFPGVGTPIPGHGREVPRGGYSHT